MAGRSRSQGPGHGRGRGRDARGLGAAPDEEGEDFELTLSSQVVRHGGGRSLTPGPLSLPPPPHLFLLFILTPPLSLLLSPPPSPIPPLTPSLSSALCFLSTQLDGLGEDGIVVPQSPALPHVRRALGLDDVEDGQATEQGRGESIL